MQDIVRVMGGVGGLALLYYGADWLVRGGNAIAARARVSPLVIGLTLVAFGTSAPELFVSASAAVQGLGDICIGNVVGSNICNIALILGLSALITPLTVNPALLRRDLPTMIAASLVCTGLCCFGGGIGRISGALLLVGICAYTVVGLAAPSGSVAGSGAAPDMGRGRAWLAVVGGLVALVVGAKLILDGAVTVERMLGIPDEVIALTVVAVGTSLPELATSVVAARKGQPDICIGNVVGSNIFNILGILGISGLLRPVAIVDMDGVDFGMMIFTAAILWPLMKMRGRLDRLDGVLLLLLYGGYVAWLVGSGQ